MSHKFSTSFHISPQNSITVAGSETVRLAVLAVVGAQQHAAPYHRQPVADVAVRARDDTVGTGGTVFTVDDRLKRATKPSKHSKEMAITVYLIHYP